METKDSLTPAAVIAALAALGHEVEVDVLHFTSGRKVTIFDRKCQANWIGQTLEEAYERARRLLDPRHPENIKGVITGAAKQRYAFLSHEDGLVLHDGKTGRTTVLIGGDREAQLVQLGTPGTNRLKPCLKAEARVDGCPYCQNPVNTHGCTPAYGCQAPRSY